MEIFAKTRARRQKREREMREKLGCVFGEATRHDRWHNWDSLRGSLHHASLSVSPQRADLFLYPSAVCPCLCVPVCTRVRACVYVLSDEWPPVRPQFFVLGLPASQRAYIAICMLLILQGVFGQFAELRLVNLKLYCILKQTSVVWSKKKKHFFLRKKRKYCKGALNYLNLRKNQKMCIFRTDDVSRTMYIARREIACIYIRVKYDWDTWFEPVILRGRHCPGRSANLKLR